MDPFVKITSLNGDIVHIPKRNICSFVECNNKYIITLINGDTYLVNNAVFRESMNTFSYIE
jgi:uncharacterized protein YlzI (FlbEa/FlbD family)